ncbi:hypothetical protein THRCLA_11267 [Thraustotheca clavata]|uniref:Uncharacterized protein n=1 Tax=Thraustotheca clavata TaxID=74557 RepID=A0A1V9Y8A1_9STRA|nr:hypothetical protein THRCLA_11267 [Thraustotheca clavata]
MNVKFFGGFVIKVSYLHKTSLHLAARYGHIYIVKLLLAARASINSLTYVKQSLHIVPSIAYHRSTPIHFAADNGHYEVIEIFIKNRAIVHPEGEVSFQFLIVFSLDFNSPLHLAAEKGHDKVVELLTKNSAPLDSINSPLFDLILTDRIDSTAFGSF